MGYTIEFEGAFSINPPLTPYHHKYLKKFSQVRHMLRDPEATAMLPDPLREAVGLPLGEDAIYYVGSTTQFGQDDPRLTPGLLLFDTEPHGAPGLWCNWEPGDDGASIVWNGVKKFRSYVEWLQFIIDRFLLLWGYAITGQVSFQGREKDDNGTITIIDGKAVQTYNEVTE